MIHNLPIGRRVSRAALAALACAAAGLCALTATAVPDQPAAPAQQGSYHLIPRDLVRIFVQGQPDVSVERRIDNRGEINVPLLGMLRISGLTVGDAQDLIARKYVDAEIFVRPEVVVSVAEYSPRQVIVLGQVSKPGDVDFPPETDSMSIVEAIASAGGFTRLSNPGSVRVTRKDDQGSDQTITLDVAQMIDGHAKAGATIYPVHPGDVIFVPERIF